MKKLLLFCLALLSLVSVKAQSVDVTATYLTNYTKPYATTANLLKVDNNRFKEIAIWNTEGQVGIYGDGVVTTWHADGNKGDGMTLTASWDGFAGPLTDMKIYQTVTLPAGKFKISTSQVEDGGGASKTYLTVATGTTLPNFADAANALGSITCDADAIQVVFDLAVETEVTIGLVASLGAYDSWTAGSFKLETITGADYTALNTLLTTANAMTSEYYPTGSAVGNYGQTEWNALQTALTAANAFVALGENGSQAEVDAHKTAVQTAVDNLNNSCVLPVVSTEAEPVWYQIIAATLDESKYYYSKGISLKTGDDLVFEAADVVSSQMFRFEGVDGTDSVRIINHVSPDGEILNTASPIEYGTSVNTVWAFVQLEGSTGIQYNITSGDKTLHMEAGGNIVSWSASYNSASAFKFYTSNDVLGMSISNSQNKLDTYPVGSNPGQFSTEAKATFQTAIDDATAVKNNAASTQDDIIAASASLTVAETEFDASANPIKYTTLGSTTTYKIKCSTRSQPYLTDGGIDAGVLGSLDSDTPELLWTIVDLGDGTAHVISVASNGHIEKPAANSTTLNLVSTPQAWKIFSVGNGQFSFQSPDGTRTWHLAGGNNLVCYGSIGTGAAGFYLEQYSTTTAIDEQEVANIRVYAIDHMLVVKGSDAPVTAYSITGVKVDVTKPLVTGIYIVKVADTTTKVFVH